MKDVIKGILLLFVLALFKYVVAMGFATLFIKLGVDLLLGITIDLPTAIRYALGSFCVAGLIDVLYLLLKTKTKVTVTKE